MINNSDQLFQYIKNAVNIAYFELIKPLHVVVSYSEEEEKCYVITAYIPDNKHFEDDLCTRRIK